MAYCIIIQNALLILHFKYKPWFYSLAPSGPALNIKTSSRSTSSLSFTWDPPEKDKQNGVIITYTACVSHSENGPCLEIFTTSKREWIVRNLNALTKYYVRVLAINKAGSSVYSGSKGFFTNGSKYNLHIWILSVVKKTAQNFMFAYFYVVQKPYTELRYSNTFL